MYVPLCLFAFKLSEKDETLCLLFQCVCSDSYSIYNLQYLLFYNNTSYTYKYFTMEPQSNFHEIQINMKDKNACKNWLENMVLSFAETETWGSNQLMFD